MLTLHIVTIFDFHRNSALNTASVPYKTKVFSITDVQFNHSLSHLSYLHCTNPAIYMDTKLRLREAMIRQGTDLIERPSSLNKQENSHSLMETKYS